MIRQPGLRTQGTTDKPLVTVILRTYRRPTLLPKAAKSVLDQTFSDFELLIIDDASGDATAGAAAAIVATDQRVRYLANETNRGPGATFNAALSHAKGALVAFIDDDDLWRPTKLERQVDAFTTAGPEVAIVTCGLQHFDLSTGEPLASYMPDPGERTLDRMLLEGGRVVGPPSAVMIRNSAFDVVGPFSETLPRGCCQDLFRRVARKYRVTSVDEILVDYAIHGQRITHHSSESSLRNDLHGRLYKLEQFSREYENLPIALARELEVIAGIQLKLGHRSASRRSVRRASRTAGTSKLQVYLYIASFLPKPWLRSLRQKRRRHAHRNRDMLGT